MRLSQPSAEAEMASQHVIEEDEAGGISAMLSRLEAECSDGALLGNADGGDEEAMGAAEGDFLAAMRQMMAAHGGDGSDSEEEDFHQ